MSVVHKACPSCTSSDGYADYGEGKGGHCFVCQYTVPSDDYLEEQQAKKNGKTKSKQPKKDQMTQEKQEKTKPAVTAEQTAELKSRTTIKGNGYRGIKDNTLSAFGVRTEYNENTGEVYATYYPTTENGELSGWKPRVHPKSFGGSIGRTGNTCDLFGQFKFKNGGKTVLIVGGEHDQLAAYQMLQDYYKSKSWEFDTPVVSPTVGESGCAKQIAAQYSFFDSFEKIIIGLDNDKAGIEAVDKIVSVLPKGKVFIAKWSKKDPNEMLQADLDKAFINDFYSAKAFVPAGVVGSSELYDKMIEQAGRERIPFPPFMSKLEKMLGSFELQTCGVIAAGTGAAKTTIANEIIYHLLFNTEYKTGIVSLELDAGQYAQALLSRHLHNRISSIDDPVERVAYLKTDQIKGKADELFKKENGSDRFMVLDERDFSIEVMEDKILEMVISGGCQIIILDPVSDLFESLPHEAAAGFMKFLKSTMKNYPVSFLLLAHIRKSSDNKGAASSGGFVPEEAIFGSGSLIKSASWVAMLSRDKYNSDPVIRNTTHVVLSKNRRGSVTGEAGKLYYCSDKHQMYDLDVWKEENGVAVDF
jgi:twinkle protein